jgi:hypothetical protein
MGDAFVIRRRRGPFAFNLSVHKVVGFVVWVPLAVITFTGAAFAFPNMNKWFENATPGQRDFDLWVPGDDVVSADAGGRQPLGLDAAAQILTARYPDRAVNYLAPPYDETGHYMAWVTRGFDPWTREGGAGNTYVALDQYTGEDDLRRQARGRQRLRPGLGRLELPTPHRRLRRLRLTRAVDVRRPESARTGADRRDHVRHTVAEAPPPLPPRRRPRADAPRVGARGRPRGDRLMTN